MARRGNFFSLSSRSFLLSQCCRGGRGKGGLAVGWPWPLSLAPKGSGPRSGPQHRRRGIPSPPVALQRQRPGPSEIPRFKLRTQVPTKPRAKFRLRAQQNPQVRAPSQAQAPPQVRAPRGAGFRFLRNRARCAGRPEREGAPPSPSGQSQPQTTSLQPAPRTKAPETKPTPQATKAGLDKPPKPRASLDNAPEGLGRERAA
jgi:hypothetical protein